ncbi:hypothetical protein [Halovivax gelatinilyticus]|uniref:hypothetical protein n=1 Tax=Halovivax gelatinilyticus TaxID=2961597 RepID=UPI0020CA6848|nr:hypothetical protein [Halovivax gelatinilyticus]
MRLSVPGVPGVYYDSDAKSTAVTTALTAVGRKTPKPKGWAIQALPLLWSIDVDLQEVPNDHPFQYLHPEGAHSVEALYHDRVTGEGLGNEFERALQFVYAIERETERGVDELLGMTHDDEDGTVIEISDESDEPSLPANAATGEGRDAPTHDTDEHDATSHDEFGGSI